jgi:hypothetical protein
MKVKSPKAITTKGKEKIKFSNNNTRQLLYTVLLQPPVDR